MLDLNLTIWKITLNINGLNIKVERQRFSYWLKKEPMKYINTNIYIYGRIQCILKFMLKNMQTLLLRKVNCINMRQSKFQDKYTTRGKEDIS